MKIYLIAFRLYAIWYAIVHILALFVVFKTSHLNLGIATEATSIAAIYFVAQPAVKRFEYFFNNQGYSTLLMFGIIASVNLAIFIVVAQIFRFL